MKPSCQTSSIASRSLPSEELQRNDHPCARQHQRRERRSLVGHRQLYRSRCRSGICPLLADRRSSRWTWCFAVAGYRRCEEEETVGIGNDKSSCVSMGSSYSCRSMSTIAGETQAGREKKEEGLEALFDLYGNLDGLVYRKGYCISVDIAHMNRESSAVRRTI